MIFFRSLDGRKIPNDQLTKNAYDYFLPKLLQVFKMKIVQGEHLHKFNLIQAVDLDACSAF